MSVYEPAEDSFLLAKVVRKYARGKVLDVGTGSGIQALTAKKNRNVTAVVAIDTDEGAVQAALQQGIRVKKSDVFSAVAGKFDTIICNPPYLPQDKGINDKAIYGGKKGHEFIESLLHEVSAHLEPRGRVLLLFSSLTGKKKVEEVIQDYCFDAEPVAEKKLFGETLFVYQLTKSALLKTLEKKSVRQLKRYAKGKRSVVWSGFLGRKKIIVKTTVARRIKNEVFWLKKLNKKKIAPLFFFAGKDYFCCQFIEGVTIKELLKNASSQEKERVAQHVLQQCRVLDMMGITKEEMHNPRKHIIIGKKIVLIDFERTKKTDKPKNVTQCCQYFSRQFNMPELRELARQYKKNYKEDKFKQIQNALRKKLC